MKEQTRKKTRDWLKWTAAGFALIATASAEYELARAIGMSQWIAAAVPGALDAYAVRALRAHKEVLTAVLAMVGVNAASHLVTAGVLHVGWPLITAVSAIAPLVLWRVHALSTPGEVRERAIWGVPLDGNIPVSEEHTEHGDVVTCPWCGWNACPVNELSTHQGHTCPKRFEHAVKHTDEPGWDRDWLSAWEEHGVLDRNGDDVTVPVAGNTPVPEEHTTVLWPVPAYEEPVPEEHTTVLAPVIPLPVGFEDEYMAEARMLDKEARRSTGNGMSVRALKDVLRVGTTRAQNLKRALEAEHTSTLA